MAKTLIGTRFTGDLAGGVIGNVQVIELYEFVDDADGVAIGTREFRRDATGEELAAILGPQLATAAVANATLNAQNTTLQDDTAALRNALEAVTAERAALTSANAELAARLERAVAAVDAVIAADAAWDGNVRTALAAARG